MDMTVNELELRTPFEFTMAVKNTKKSTEMCQWAIRGSFKKLSKSF